MQTGYVMCIASLTTAQRVRGQARPLLTALLVVTFVAFAVSGGMPEFIIASSLNSDPSVASVHRTFWLRGSAISGWNGTVPGPTITVSSGDLVSIMLLSADSPDFHNWYVDANQSATTSSDFSCATYCLNFTFTPMIGACVNIPQNCVEISHGGDWTYICQYHSGIMRGTFRI